MVIKFRSKAVDSSQSELAHLRKQIGIDKHALDEAVMRQPVLFDQVAERYTLLVSQRDAAKTVLEEIYAKMSLAIRAQKRQDRVTIDEINARIITNETYKRADKEYQALVAETAQWATLRESFMQRGYMIRELCGLYATQYWGQTSMKGGSTEDRAVSKVRETVRLRHMKVRN